MGLISIGPIKGAFEASPVTEGPERADPVGSDRVSQAPPPTIRVKPRPLGRLYPIGASCAAAREQKTLLLLLPEPKFITGSTSRWSKSSELASTAAR